MLISKISYSNKSIYNVVKIKVMRLSTIFIEIFTVIASIDLCLAIEIISTLKV